MDDTVGTTGYFLFSLDTELAWGYFDQFSYGRFSNNGQLERNSIKHLLDLLDKYNICATWAVVGHLFYDKCENCELCPILEWRGKYWWFDNIYRTNNQLWYGADIIDMLLKEGHRHEIAFHGFTHKIFDETTMDDQDARFEIHEWIRQSRKKNLIPQTVIFPRNKIGFLPIFKENGFICYRGEELMPEVYSMPIIGRFLKRFHRQLSSFYISKTYELPNLDQNGLVNLPSTQHFFGFDRRVKRIIDTLRLNQFNVSQMIRGVKKAADERKIIHIRAHPCDFKTENDYKYLCHLFESVSTQVDKGLLQSVGMIDLARKVYKTKNLSC